MFTMQKWQWYQSSHESLCKYANNTFNNTCCFTPPHSKARELKRQQRHIVHQPFRSIWSRSRGWCRWVSPAAARTGRRCFGKSSPFWSLLPARELETETQTDRGVKKRGRVPSWFRFSGSSVSGVASWWLSVVPVSLIQFAARWGHIKGCGPGLLGGMRWCTLMQPLAGGW